MEVLVRRQKALVEVQYLRGTIPVTQVHKLRMIALVSLPEHNQSFTRTPLKHCCLSLNSRALHKGCYLTKGLCEHSDDRGASGRRIGTSSVTIGVMYTVIWIMAGHILGLSVGSPAVETKCWTGCYPVLQDSRANVREHTPSVFYTFCSLIQTGSESIHFPVIHS